MLGRFGVERLLVGTMALAIPRWALMTILTSPVAIVAVNTVHGITFGMFWIAGVAIMSDRARIAWRPVLKACWPLPWVASVAHLGFWGRVAGDDLGYDDDVQGRDLASHWYRQRLDGRPSMTLMLGEGLRWQAWNKPGGIPVFPPHADRNGVACSDAQDSTRWAGIPSCRGSNTVWIRPHRAGALCEDAR